MNKLKDLLVLRLLSKISSLGINIYSLVDEISNSRISNLSKLYSPYNVSDCQIGDYSYISRNSRISNVDIGKFCSIGPNFLCGWGIHPLVGVSTSPIFYSTQQQSGTTFSMVDKIDERKKILIGNDVFIGANVTVLDGVNIGHGAVIGAGSVVSKNIPPYAIAFGSPIIIHRFRFSEEQISALLKIKWWDFNHEDLKSVEENFFDIDLFIRSHLNDLQS